MTWRERAADVFDLVFRMFPHASRPGLRRIGNPDADSPVLLTGNYTLTLRRMGRALRGRDAWLLAADSRGINVWCAAGGGHLTDHDVIAVVRSSRIGEQVRHRRLVLPQLAATGVERHRVGERTGWECVWGPARLEDLPAFLDRGQHLRKGEREMRFPLWERFEMATIWALPVTVLAAVLLWVFVDAPLAAVAAATLLVAILSMFALLPWLRVWGRGWWLTYAGVAAAGTAAGALVLVAAGEASAAHLTGLAFTCAAAMALLSIDLTGTTPWYPGGVNSLGNHFHIELVRERCTGAAECVQVCPRNVLAMDGKNRVVRIARPDDCIRCGACIVQCPDDALRFRFADGSVVEPATVRSTRVNMLGRRTVQLPAADAEAKRAGTNVP